MTLANLLANECSETLSKQNRLEGLAIGCPGFQGLCLQRLTSSFVAVLFKASCHTRFRTGASRNKSFSLRARPLHIIITEQLCGLKSTKYRVGQPQHPRTCQLEFGGPESTRERSKPYTGTTLYLFMRHIMNDPPQPMVEATYGTVEAVGTILSSLS